MTDLPAGWTWTTVGEVCDINSRNFDEVPGDDDLVSKVPMAAVEAESGLLDPSKLVAYGSVKGKSLTPFQEDDVLFAKVTPCMENGKIALARDLYGGRAVGSTELFALRSWGAIEPKYLMYFLLQGRIRKVAEWAMTGAVGLRRVPRPFLSSLQIPLPPLAEQRRIVAELDDYVGRIRAQVSSLRSALDRAVSFKDQIISTWMVGLSEQFHEELSAADVDDGILPILLPGWEWKRLGEVAEVVGGITKDSKKQGDPSFIEVPYLRVANVQRGLLNLTDIATIRVARRKADQLRLRAGDVLLNEGGDRDKLGRGWVWEGQIDNCIHQNHVFRARVHSGIVHPKIIAWHANGFGKAWCERNGKQTTNLASISLNRIKKLPVPIPPRDFDQESMVREVESRAGIVQRGMSGIESALSQAQKLRSELFILAFSGQLVPQDPADESASIMLERITRVRPTAKRRRHSMTNVAQAEVGL
jgi:type I restriction enzyme S subunit